MSLLLSIHPNNPQPRLISQVVNTLKNGGIIIYPTDTIYGIGCDLHNPKAVEKVCRLKDINPKKMNLSFICHDLSHISEYARQVDNQVFRLLKKSTPGPYTFILEASSKVPKIVGQSKKTVGIRVPDNAIIRNIVQELGNPVLSTSVKSDDAIQEYLTDPEEIFDQYGKVVDIVIDGGFGKNIPSTVLDCSNGDVVLVRQGLGEFEE